MASCSSGNRGCLVQGILHGNECTYRHKACIEMKNALAPISVRSHLCQVLYNETEHLRTCIDALAAQHAWRKAVAVTAPQGSMRHDRFVLAAIGHACETCRMGAKCA